MNSARDAASAEAISACARPLWSARWATTGVDRILGRKDVATISPMTAGSTPRLANHKGRKGMLTPCRP
ncbi:hypothetical protein D3C73_1548510 [compost metagenome]